MSRLSDAPLLALRIQGAEPFFVMLRTAVNNFLGLKLGSDSAAHIKEKKSALETAMNLAKPLMTRENVVETVNYFVLENATAASVLKEIVRRIAEMWSQQVMRDEAKQTLKRSMLALLEPDRAPQTKEDVRAFGNEFVQILKTAGDSVLTQAEIVTFVTELLDSVLTLVVFSPIGSKAALPVDGVLTLAEIETFKTKLSDVMQSTNVIFNLDLLKEFLTVWIEEKHDSSQPRARFPDAVAEQ